MASLSFPDVNVWLALVMADHVHRQPARKWWTSSDSELISFTRFTQISVLRILTTAAAMNGNPLSMRDAWHACDRLLFDDRVTLMQEPAGLETQFRSYTRGKTPSPKLWADAYLAAFAELTDGHVVTFDRALAGLSAGSIFLD
jgi:toxin-antitoxin system PIN domain toxin